ncbi:MAG: ROK family protein [Actinomycetaceae bacterium]|nr:ROK family protein [Actinomycetaceae bacterium]MDY5855303.1 ROK family protein [Arcanobacterium sp.]
MAKTKNLAIGIDIGGSGIKGAPVSMKSGKFKAERLRIPTPENAAPGDIAEIVRTIADSFDLPDAPVGVDFPAPIVNGVVPYVANLSQEWKGVAVEELFTETLGRPVTVLNDADAAGYAEVYYGAARGRQGTCLMLTLGTGIGSALVREGVLVPNTEFGHIALPNGQEDAEKWAAASVFERDQLSFEEWAGRLQMIFDALEMYLTPDVLIIGGGVSKQHDQFLPLIHTRAQLVPAQLRNKAGIVGAALMAHQRAKA